MENVFMEYMYNLDVFLWPTIADIYVIQQRENPLLVWTYEVI